MAKVKQILMWIGAAVMLSLGACSSDNEHGAQRLTAEQFATYIDNRAPQIVDVRTNKEYLTGHLPDAINIDIRGQRFDNQVREKLSTERPVAVYCLRGNRSQIAADIMIGMGYTVVELEQGLTTWKGAVEK